MTLNLANAFTITAGLILTHQLLSYLHAHYWSQNPSCRKVKDIMNKKIISNFISKIIVDSCLEVSFCCLINIKLERVFRYP